VGGPWIDITKGYQSSYCIIGITSTSFIISNKENKNYTPILDNNMHKYYEKFITLHSIDFQEIVTLEKKKDNLFTNTGLLKNEVETYCTAFIVNYMKYGSDEYNHSYLLVTAAYCLYNHENKKKTWSKKITFSKAYDREVDNIEYEVTDIWIPEQYKVKTDEIEIFDIGFAIVQIPKKVPIDDNYKLCFLENDDKAYHFKEIIQLGYNSYKYRDMIIGKDPSTFKIPKYSTTKSSRHPPNFNSNLIPSDLGKGAS